MFDRLAEAVFAVDTSNWKKERKFVVRRNVVFALTAIATLFAIWQVATNLWWTETGYCWGDMIECYFPEKGE